MLRDIAATFSSRSAPARALQHAVHIFIILLLVLCPLAIGGAQGGNLAYSELESGFYDTTLHSFRGSADYWNCTWVVAENGMPFMGSHVLSAGEIRCANDGFEQLRIRWKTPLRNDLTPDVHYFRRERDKSITITGNDRGPRGLIMSATDTTGVQNPVMRMLSEPASVFSRNSVSEVFNSIDLGTSPQSSVAALNLRHPSKHLSILWHPRYSFDKFAALGVIESQPSCRVAIELESLNRSQFPEETSRLYASEMPAKIDACIESGGGNTRSNQQLVRRISYRVLEWQAWHGNGGQTPKDKKPPIIPRLVLWDEIVERPGPLQKLHRMSLFLVKTREDRTQQLRTDWENVLPNLRILDARNGTARVNELSDKSLCGAWNCLARLSNDSYDFFSCLDVDLKLNYPNILQSGEALETATSSREVGVKQVNRQLRAFPDDFFDGGKYSYSIDSNVGKKATRNQPELLRFIDRYREYIRVRDSQQSDQHVKRKGYVPVDTSVHKRARKHFIILQVLTVTAILVASVVYYSLIRKSNLDTTEATL